MWTLFSLGHKLERAENPSKKPTLLPVFSLLTEVSNPHVEVQHWNKWCLGLISCLLHFPLLQTALGCLCL